MFLGYYKNSLLGHKKFTNSFSTPVSYLYVCETKRAQMATLSNRQPGTCLYHDCGKEFAAMESLTLHYLSQHPDIGACRYPLCAHVFATRGDMERHWKGEHEDFKLFHVQSDDNDYSCFSCGKTLNSKLERDRHFNHFHSAS